MTGRAGRLLCELRQVTEPLWASAASPGNNGLCSQGCCEDEMWFQMRPCGYNASSYEAPGKWPVLPLPVPSLLSPWSTRPPAPSCRPAARPRQSKVPWASIHRETQGSPSGRSSESNRLPSPFPLPPPPHLPPPTTSRRAQFSPGPSACPVAARPLTPTSAVLGARPARTSWPRVTQAPPQPQTSALSPCVCCHPCPVPRARGPAGAGKTLGAAPGPGRAALRLGPAACGHTWFCLFSARFLIETLQRPPPPTLTSLPARTR